MNIYVKFCGGCNPRFDRVALYHRLQTDFPHLNIHTDADRANTAQLVIIMQGCERACAKAEGIPGEIERFHVTSVNDYDILVQKLRSWDGGSLA